MNTLLITSEKTVTVIMPTEVDADGRPITLVLNKEDWDEEQLNQLNDMSARDVLSTFNKQTDEQKAVAEAISLLRQGIGATEFVEVGDSIHHADVKGISLPPELFLEMSEALNSGNFDYYTSLKYFWMRCALNHNVQARHDLFAFIKGNGFYLTPTGMLCTFRSVVEKPFTLDGKRYGGLFSFVREEYEKIRSWKKSPKNYTVLSCVPSYSTFRVLANDKVSDNDQMYVLGNLHDLWSRVQKEAVFTDAHTGTFRIKLNEVVEIQRNDCDYDNDNACSYGLHVGTPEFVEGGGFGNVAMAVLVNPTDVVAVPSYDVKKMRTCRYLPISFVSRDNIQPPDNLAELEYSAVTMYDLQKQVNSHSLNELEQYRILPQDISSGVFNSIKTNIDNIKDSIKDRTKFIKTTVKL